MEDRRRYAAVLLLLLALYVGSYLALVRIGNPYAAGSGWAENYRVGGSVSKAIYWPIHKIDRRLRPEYWDTVSTWPPRQKTEAR